MESMDHGRSFAPAWWLACVAPALALLLVTARGPLADITWHSPLTLFWLVLIAASLCAVAALVVIAIGWRRGLGEVAILGAAVLAVSVLPLVHGLTTPGILYGANSATLASAFLAVPLAMIVAAPLIAPHLAAMRRIAVSWRPWTALWICVALGLSALLLARPNVLPAPQADQLLTYIAVAISLLGALVLSLRHLRLHRIGRRQASFVASVGLMYIGLSALVWIVEQPYSVGWWAAHLIDITGVFAALFGLGFAHYRDRSLASILAPVVNRDPAIALELGLTPTVHRFVAALEQKDSVTREHVVRVGELAVRVGLRADLGPDRVRNLGLAALLHDVGKLFTPDAILKKPGALTDAEFDTVKEHTVWGHQLMQSSPLLAPAAKLVRWHHERPDGRGYPDGLAEHEIPTEVGIISVCDALDAMTSTRQYRTGMREDAAIEILRDGAGSQWSPRAVELVLAELDEHGTADAPAFADVGTEAARTARASGERLIDDCAGALPEQARLALGLSPS